MTRLPHSINDDAATSCMELQIPVPSSCALHTGHLNARASSIRLRQFTSCLCTSICISVKTYSPIVFQQINTVPVRIKATIMTGFLAFSRRAATTSLRNTAVFSKPIATRSFSIAASRQASGVPDGKQPDSDHTTRKDDRLDVQTDNSMKGRE